MTLNTMSKCVPFSQKRRVCEHPFVVKVRNQCKNAGISAKSSAVAKKWRGRTRGYAQMVAVLAGYV